MFSRDDFTVWFFGVEFFIYQICNNVMLWHSCTAASCQKPTLPRNNRKDGNYMGHCIKVCLFLFMFCGQGLKILFPPKNCLCVAFEVFCVCTFRRELCLVVLWSWDIECMGSLEFEASVSCTRKQCRLTRFQFICWIVFFFLLDLQQTLHVFQRYNSKGLLLLWASAWEETLDFMPWTKWTVSGIEQCSRSCVADFV